MTALSNESVLSTRTLSSASIGEDAFISPPTSSATFNSWPSIHTQQDTCAESSDDGEDMEMADARRGTITAASQSAALPDSVMNSLLFSLPREIRERIYALCLTSHNGVPVIWPASSAAFGIQAQLLRTCKVIYSETVPLLYSLNTMTFHHPSDANMFVRAMSSLPHASCLTKVNLHIRAQDTRLWMPYLTSTDESRSLRADFPNLRDIAVRFRSNWWQQHHTPDVNIRNWSNDGRLDEVMDGLRHVFHSGPSKISDAEFQAAIAHNPVRYYSFGNNIPLIREVIALEKAGSAAISLKEAPRIRICCACRVNDAHFDLITRAITTHPDHHSLLPRAREGDEYSGYSLTDLQTPPQRLSDPDLGCVNVLHTPYTLKDGIFVAVELHCLEPRKDPPFHLD